VSRRWWLAWLALFSLEAGATIGAIAFYRLLHWDRPQFLAAATIGALVCGLMGGLVWGSPSE
jgi:hypothetical protein